MCQKVKNVFSVPAQLLSLSAYKYAQLRADPFECHDFIHMRKKDTTQTKYPFLFLFIRHL